MSLFIVFLFLWSGAYTQTNNYVLKQYNSDNGLPQNTVKQINFDRNGFCWLATESGIVRFDNFNFKSYGGGLIKGLKAERTTMMMSDTAGNIFAKNVDYQTIKIAASLSDYSFLPVIDDTSNHCFVSSGYLTYSPATDRLWDSIRTSENLKVLKPAAGLKNGDIYLFFARELYYIHKSTVRQLMSNEMAPVSSFVLNDRFLLQVWPGNKIKLWNNGMAETGQILGDLIHNKDYMDGVFKTLWCEQGAFIYAGNSLYQLLYINGTVVSKCIVSNLNIETPLCIAFKPELNTYFIGTATQGMFTVKVPDFIYLSVPEQSGPQNYYAIGKTSDGHLLINDAVIRPDNTSFYFPLHNRNNLATYTDSLDRIYYEGEFQLCRYNPQTGLMERDLLQLDNRLRAILPNAADGTLLLTTHTSLYKVTPDGKVIWQRKIFSDEYIRAVGLLALGSEQIILPTSVGLKWYDLNSHKITKSILDSVYIRTVYRDKAERLWIGTDGKGSYLYTNNKLYDLPLGPGEAFKSIHSFIEDKSGNFWLPTNNGLYKVNIKSLVEVAIAKTGTVIWFTYNKENGLRTTEFNGGGSPGFQWLKDGALVLPSINGLVKFYPDQLKTDYPGERIFIDEMSIDGKQIDLKSAPGTIYLKPSFKTVSIKVASPYFGNRENLMLEYKIGADDGEWIRVPLSGIISLNTLPANQYQLVVRKVGSKVDAHNASIILKLVVNPFFYQTNWFRLAIMIIIIGSGYVYYKRRLTNLKKEKLKIEKLVDIRTGELSKAISELEISEIALTRSNEILENSEAALKKSNETKEQIITTVLHDLRSPLYSMRSASKLLIRDWNISEKKNLNQVMALNQLIGEMGRFTDDFFSWAISQQDEFKVKFQSFPLQLVFEELEALFKEVLLVNNNRFAIHQTDINCYTDKDILVLVLRNLIDNANKNMEHGSITVKAMLQMNVLQIEVIDTGKGLNDFQIENFLSRDKAVKNGRMGSVIILEMLGKINGSLSVTTKEGKGASFTISINQVGSV